MSYAPGSQLACERRTSSGTPRSTPGGRVHEACSQERTRPIKTGTLARAEAVEERHHVLPRVRRVDLVVFGVGRVREPVLGVIDMDLGAHAGLLEARLERAHLLGRDP